MCGDGYSKHGCSEAESYDGDGLLVSCGSDRKARSLSLSRLRSRESCRRTSQVPSVAGWASTSTSTSTVIAPNPGQAATGSAEMAILVLCCRCLARGVVAPPTATDTETGVVFVMLGGEVGFLRSCLTRVLRTWCGWCSLSLASGDRTGLGSRPGGPFAGGRRQGLVCRGRWRLGGSLASGDRPGLGSRRGGPQQLTVCGRSF